MKNLSQSPRIHIFEILASNEGAMERSNLRKRMAWKYALLDRIIEDLAMEGKIDITPGKHGNMIKMISLKK